jgi:putative addiction module CopG family antidote
MNRAEIAGLMETTMPYHLPPDVLDQIRQQIATGHYASEDDVLRAALQALSSRHDDLAAIQAGIDDMEAGRMRPFDEVDADIRRQFGFPDER